MDHHSHMMEAPVYAGHSAYYHFGVRGHFPYDEGLMVGETQADCTVSVWTGTPVRERHSLRQNSLAHRKC